MTDLSGRHILVTGAGAGIGLGILRQCRAAGARVTGFDNRAEARAAIQAEGATFAQVDVGDAPALAAAVAALGPLDGIVNNAGITIQTPFEDMPVADMDLLWRVNQRAPMIVVQAALPAMPRGAAIVNVASNHARASDQGYEAYAGTKGALTAMTRAMAWSLGPRGIRVNALAPGLTMTEAVTKIAKEQDCMDLFNSWHATGHVSTVDEVGAAAAWLLSDAAAALTGAEILADQGMSARLGAL